MRELPEIMLEAAQLLAKYEASCVALKKYSLNGDDKALQKEIDDARRMVAELGMVSVEYGPSKAIQQWAKGNKEALKAVEHVKYAPTNPA